ncbi:MAG: FHA domain-containing protein [Phycisphaerales bacterium JB040]
MGLLVIAGTSDRLRIVELNEDEVVVGRSPRCAVVVSEGSVSRRHALIRRVGATGEHVIEDLGSVNGVAVNGERIAGPRRLRDGDTLALGRLGVRYRAELSVTRGDPESETDASALDKGTVSCDALEVRSGGLTLV